MTVANIEHEFGVPIPGEIVDREKWASSALKKLPPGPIDWSAIFGRSAPLVVDLGCGNGRFCLTSAVAHPEWDHVGVDLLPLVLRYATRRANQRGLANIRFAAVDGLQFVTKYLGDRSVREVHCYHPQPYYERHQIGRRLITPLFLAELTRVLEPGGRFIVQTDNQPYWKSIANIAPSFFEFAPREDPWDDAPDGRTRREILARRRKMPIYRGVGVVKSFTPEEAKALAATLPLPRFHAGRPPRDIDAEERE